MAKQGKGGRKSTSKGKSSPKKRSTAKKSAPKKKAAPKKPTAKKPVKRRKKKTQKEIIADLRSKNRLLRRTNKEQSAMLSYLGEMGVKPPTVGKAAPTPKKKRKPLKKDAPIEEQILHEVLDMQDNMEARNGMLTELLTGNVTND